jgi:hypothetical protein
MRKTFPIPPRAVVAVGHPNIAFHLALLSLRNAMLPFARRDSQKPVQGAGQRAADVARPIQTGTAVSLVINRAVWASLWFIMLPGSLPAASVCRNYPFRRPLTQNLQRRPSESGFLFRPVLAIFFHSLHTGPPHA